MKNHSNIKTYQIYKKDKWNMLSVEVNGKSLIVREISDQWGEECHTFLSRPEMMHWVERRFPPGDFVGKEDERESLLTAFRDI